MDNENNRDFLNSEKGEFIVNKKDEDKEKINTMSEKGEFIVNKKIESKENIKNKEDNKYTTQDKSVPQKDTIEENKNKGKNKKIIPFLILGFVVMGILALALKDAGSSNYNYVDYANKGVEVNEYFEMYPEDFAYTANYITKRLYKNDFNGVEIPLLDENLSFNDSKGYYELIIDEKYDFKILIYPSPDYEKIEKIYISYNWIDADNNGELEKLNKLYSAFINIIQTSIWGYNNDNSNLEILSTNMWDKLNSIEYKYTQDGVPYGEVTYKDDKIIYNMKDTKDGFNTLTFTPNNK